MAWAQHTGIDAVEVSADGGPWQRAELAAEPTVDAWRMWRLPLTLTPGAHRLQVRAVDRSGYVQTVAGGPVHPRRGDRLAHCLGHGRVTAAAACPWPVTGEFVRAFTSGTLG